MSVEAAASDGQTGYPRDSVLSSGPESSTVMAASTGSYAMWSEQLRVWKYHQAKCMPQCYTSSLYGSFKPQQAVADNTFESGSDQLQGREDKHKARDAIQSTR